MAEEEEEQHQIQDIFGGDSDLSDVTDDEDDDQQQQPPLSSGQRPRVAESDVDDEEEDEEEEADIYDDDEDTRDKDGGEYKSTSISALKIKKKPREVREGSDHEEEGRIKKKKKVKKDKEPRPVREEEEEEEVDPDVARRRALDARLDAIIKKPKNRMSKKRRGGGEDDLEAMNDEAVVRLRNEMFSAADADINENEEGKYAIHKLRMLPTVVDMMQRASLAESLVDNGLLEAVKRWLEPLPDKSLPAVNIQRPLFEILRNLSIETSALKSSGLGKIVYFYTKCPRVEPFIRRIADQLVADWMRPIIRRSKAFTDKILDEDEDEEDREVRRKILAMSGGGKKKKVEEKGVQRRHARIPEMLTTSYRLAPDSGKEGGGGMGGSHGSTGVTLKMRSFKKKLIAGQQAQRRV